MAERTWADDWDGRRAGVDCPMCAEGRAEIDANGNRRFFAGSHTDAYLQRHAPQAGYATVRWRGRHVPDVIDMTAEEVEQFWREVVAVARAITAVFQPCHLNYELLGNFVPHVHVHVVPRYLDDPSPNTPLKPWVLQPVDVADLLHHVEELRGALRTP